MTESPVAHTGTYFHAACLSCMFCGLMIVRGVYLYYPIYPFISIYIYIQDSVDDHGLSQGKSGNPWNSEPSSFKFIESIASEVLRHVQEDQAKGSKKESEST